MKEKKYDEWFPCYQHPPQGEIVLTICEIYGDKGRYVYRANMINSLDKWNWTDDGSGTGIIPVCWIGENKHLCSGFNKKRIKKNFFLFIYLIPINNSSIL